MSSPTPNARDIATLDEWLDRITTSLGEKDAPEVNGAKQARHVGGQSEIEKRTLGRRHLAASTQRRPAFGEDTRVVIRRVHPVFPGETKKDIPEVPVSGQHRPMLPEDPFWAIKTTLLRCVVV